MSKINDGFTNKPVSNDFTFENEASKETAEPKKFDFGKVDSFENAPKFDFGGKDPFDLDRGFNIGGGKSRDIDPGFNVGGKPTRDIDPGFNIGGGKTRDIDPGFTPAGNNADEKSGDSLVNRLADEIRKNSGKI